MMDFPSRGYRKKPSSGKSYRSRCRRYELYCSDQPAGISKYYEGGTLKKMPVTWLAIYCGKWQQIISRHRSRKAAIKACEQHAKKGVK